jgi:hypothetical protein
MKTEELRTTTPSRTAPIDIESDRDAARSMIAAVRDWNCPPKLPYLFWEIGIDLETLGFGECIRILAALNAELERDEYPEELKRRIRFAAPFAKAA